MPPSETEQFSTTSACASSDAIWAAGTEPTWRAHGTRRQGPLQGLALTGVEDGPGVEQPHSRMGRSATRVQGGEGPARSLDRPDSGGEHEQDPVTGQRPARRQIERRPALDLTDWGTTTSRARSDGSDLERPVDDRRMKGRHRRGALRERVGRRRRGRGRTRS